MAITKNLTPLISFHLTSRTAIVQHTYMPWSVAENKRGWVERWKWEKDGHKAKREQKNNREEQKGWGSEKR